MNDNENIEIYITKYLNTINLSNLSSHEFQLKVDIFMILLRNLSSFIELYNEIYLYIIYIN